MRSLLVVLLLTCFLAITACSDGAMAPNSSPTATPTPTVDFAAEARRLVGGAVFSAEDLPGFEPLGGDDLQTQAGLSDPCDIFDAGVVFPDALATADSGAYEGRADDQLLNLAGVYRTADDASAALALTRDLRTRCEAEFEEAVERVARDFLAGLGIEPGPFVSIDVVISEYEPAPVGDEVIGYRLHVNVGLILTSQQYNLHAIVGREGRVAGALLYGRFGPLAENPEAELLRLMEGKLSAVNESLPE